MKARIYHVEGMTCASCVRRVEKALAKVPGVEAAQVNLAQNTVSVTGDVPESTLAEALGARGYALRGTEPEQAAAEPSGLPRVLIAWALTLPLMLPMLPGIHLHLPWPVQAVLSGLAAFGAGWPFLARAARQALHRETTMDTLVALGALTAWGFGLHEGMAGRPHPPFETAAALVAFLLVGKYLEHHARHRASGSLEDLVRLAPSVALKVDAQGLETEVPTASLLPGDRVRVKPGGALPVDGIILEGQADLDESLLTGEPLPVPRGCGDSVLAGAVVHHSSLVVEVSRSGRGTWLARLADQVAEAQTSRAPAQDLADRVSAWFVPGILLLSLATLAGWWIHTGALALAWRPAVTVLVIACPCALGLATPVALATALGTSARVGLLVRDARAMDALGRVTDLVFDKTGTLTEGEPRVQEVLCLETGTTHELLRFAASLEQHSEHPLARGILRAAQGMTLSPVSAFRAHPGGGVTGLVEGRELRLGSSAFLGIPFLPVPAHATAVGLADGNLLMGILVLADPPRQESREVVQALKASGLRLHLLSGDRHEAARSLAHNLEIPEALGDARPEDKRHRIQALQAEGRVVAFVGDGVNDGPALAQADAGISLPGLDATRSTASLNLLREGLQPLLQALSLARRTRVVIRQNLAWAFGYNLVLVPLAALGLLERVGGPMVAGAAMGLSSLTVVINALRLRRS